MLTYYGNLFERANPDPYNNRNPVNTQFRLNGYSDIDRRWSDRGTLYIADGNDNHPGTVRLKSTPILGVAAPGPNSLRTGYFEPGQTCCGGRRTEEKDEEELYEECIVGSLDFLDSLPTPSEYTEQLDKSRASCSRIMNKNCNIFRVYVHHYKVSCVTSWGGGFPCCKCGKKCNCCGKVVSGRITKCETYVFPNCAAAVAFAQSLYATRCLATEYCVGDKCILSVGMGYSCINAQEDKICQRYGCQLFEDRTSPVAYDQGSGYNCGSNSSKDDRPPAEDDNAWGKYSC